MNQNEKPRIERAPGIVKLYPSYLFVAIDSTGVGFRIGLELELDRPYRTRSDLLRTSIIGRPRVYLTANPVVILLLVTGRRRSVTRLESNTKRRPLPIRLVGRPMDELDRWSSSARRSVSTFQRCAVVVHKHSMSTDVSADRRSSTNSSL